MICVSVSEMESCHHFKLLTLAILFKVSAVLCDNEVMLTIKPGQVMQCICLIMPKYQITIYAECTICYVRNQHRNINMIYNTDQGTVLAPSM